MRHKVIRYFLVPAVVLIPIHSSGQVCLGGQVEDPIIEQVTITKLSLFPELYLGKQVELPYTTVSNFVRTSLFSDGKVIFSGIAKHWRDNDSIDYGSVDWEFVLVPFDMVRELIDAGPIHRNKQHLTLYIGKGEKDNIIAAWVDSIKLIIEEPIEGERLRYRNKVYKTIESKTPSTFRKQLEKATQQWLKETEGKILPFVQLGQPMFSKESNEKAD